MKATDAAPFTEAVKRYVRSAGSLSQQQQYNIHMAAGNVNFMVVQRENGDLDVVTSAYQTSLPMYSKLYQTNDVSTVSTLGNVHHSYRESPDEIKFT